VKRQHIFTLLIITAFSSCSEDKETVFWNWFSANQYKIYDNLEHLTMNDPIVDELAEKLKEVDSNLVFEIGPKKVNGKAEISISADGMEESFSSVINLVERKPEIPKWNIIAFRQRNKGDELYLEYQNYKIGYDDIYFEYEINQNSELDIKLYISNYDNSGNMQNAVFLLLDSLIGEYDAVKKISCIEWYNLSGHEKTKFHKFVALRKIVDNINGS
jgi:hypothetical protein